MEPKAAPLKQKVRVFQNTEGGSGGSEAIWVYESVLPKRKINFLFMT